MTDDLKKKFYSVDILRNTSIELYHTLSKEFENTHASLHQLDVRNNNKHIVVHCDIIDVVSEAVIVHRPNQAPQVEIILDGISVIYTHETEEKHEAETYSAFIPLPMDEDGDYIKNHEQVRAEINQYLSSNPHTKGIHAIKPSGGW